MLASGSHVKLAGYELTLATDREGHYVHEYQPLFANRTDISGAPGQQGLRPELLVWSFSDWSGGEGNKFYDTEHPNVYYRGVANGRNPGELNAPPARDSGSRTAANPPARLMFTASGGRLYMASESAGTGGGANHFWESTDGVTWTSRDAGFHFAGESTGRIVGMASDGAHVYIMGALGNNPTTTCYISRFDTMTNTAIDFTEQPGAPGNAYFGLAFLPIAVGGMLFGWNGRVLVRWDTTTPGLDGATVFAPASIAYTSAVDKVPDSARGDVVTAENSVVFYFSMQGKSYLMEYGLGANAGARPLWNPPNGFVIKQIAYQLGTVFCLGDFGSKTALFGVPVNRSPAVFLGYIREQTSLAEADLSSSFGADLMVLSADGHVFVYNAASDTVSELADLSNTSGTFSASTTYKGLRVVGKIGGAEGTTITTYTWDHDDGTLSTSVGSSPEMPVWNFNLPLVDKVLYGFYVSSTALSETNTVTISHDLDELGSYTALPVLEAGKSNFAAISDTTASSFRQMRYKIETTGEAKVFSVSAIVGVLSSSQTWDLIIDLRPDALNRTKTQADRPDQIRGSLLRAKENKTTLTFRDGVPFQKAVDSAWDGVTLAEISTSGYRQYTVAIEDLQDMADASNGHGLMRLRLRQVVLV